MIIKPKTRGFICTTAHPVGCDKAVLQQIESVKKSPLTRAPKRVLVIGASSGYGLSSRITAAFGGQASTIGVFFEKSATEKKTATAGWYNVAAFDRYAKEAGLYAKHINADAFSDEAKQKTIELIKQDLGQIDLVVYSLASPVRKMPKTGEVIRSTLKPIDQVYRSTAVDTNKDCIIEAHIDPATDQEIQDTVTVMGGQDWELWMQALQSEQLLAPNCRTLAYSYIGTDITFPIYWEGTIGQAKKDLERAAHSLNEQLRVLGGSAHVTVLKSVVTQASAAIPMLPLYIAMVFKKMRDEGVHEGCIEQIQRLFQDRLSQNEIPTDERNRIRLDDWELREDIQQHCRDLWQVISTDNLKDLTDYTAYKTEFLNLFGFEFADIDYDADVMHQVDFDKIDLT
tara:strand:+ start:1074 stop:2267 length:1194 start_codon:yes stop_codon:yes gene_type:complete